MSTPRPSSLTTTGSGCQAWRGTGRPGAYGEGAANAFAKGLFLVPRPSAAASGDSFWSSVPARGPDPALQGREVSRRGSGKAKLRFPSLPIPGVPQPPPAPAVCQPPFCAQPLRHTQYSAQISYERLRTPTLWAPAFQPPTPHEAAVLPMPTRLTAGSHLRPTQFSVQPPVSTPKKTPPPESCTHARLSSLCDFFSAPGACVSAPGSPEGTEKGGSGRGRSSTYSGILENSSTTQYQYRSYSNLAHRQLVLSHLLRDLPRSFLPSLIH